MKLIKSMALTTGVNSMQLSDIFTNNFRVYKIVVSGIVGQESTATGANVRLIKASDGSTESGSVYEYGLYSLKAEASYSNHPILLLYGKELLITMTILEVTGVQELYKIQHLMMVLL